MIAFLWMMGCERCAGPVFLYNIFYPLVAMIELISRLEVSMNQRFDHISMLTIDSEDMHVLIKDDEKKRNMVKNFRVIKAAEKNRVVE